MTFTFVLVRDAVYGDNWLWHMSKDYDRWKEFDYLDTAFEGRCRAIKTRFVAMTEHAERGTARPVDRYFAVLVNISPVVALPYIRRELEKGSEVYVNRVGGWFPGKPKGKVLQVIIKDVFVFPDNPKVVAKVGRWPGGVHWYAQVEGAQSCADKFSSADAATRYICRKYPGSYVIVDDSLPTLLAAP